jgi:hypothetical protein
MVQLFVRVTDGTNVRSSLADWVLDAQPVGPKDASNPIGRRKGQGKDPLPFLLGYSLADIGQSTNPARQCPFSDQKIYKKGESTSFFYVTC